jgi:ferredoxin
MRERKVPSARRVTRDELAAMLEVFRKAGFIVQPANSRDPGFVCLCCGCCCNVLRSYKKMANPSRYFTSNYYAAVLDTCNGCGRCVVRCQMEAIAVHDAKAVIAAERCIGCGNCIDVCARKAMVLCEKNRRKRPAANSRHLYVKILLRKKGLPGFIALLVRRMIGLKV